MLKILEAVINMSKIDEFEQRIIKEGMTDEDFLEYGKLLKRVHDNFLKRQHCYSTAIQFSPEHADQAIKLIQYGLENFDDSWFSTYTSYLFMGQIYEKTNNYKKAFDSYLLAKNTLGEDNFEYERILSVDLLWMKLHIDCFCYSQELENYYSHYIEANEFSKLLINNEFRAAIAEIVIFLHYGKTDEARKSLEKAKKICQPNYIGKLYNILARHNYKETLNTTPEVMKFIKKIKI